MAARTALLIGTPKGAFILEGNAGRRDWQLRGPMCEGWPIHDISVDPEGTPVPPSAEVHVIPAVSGG